jgi:hypothetical protein
VLNKSISELTTKERKMNKILIGVGITSAVVLFVLAGIAGYFWARTSNRTAAFQPYGMMGSRENTYPGRGVMMDNRNSGNYNQNNMMGGRGGMMGYRENDDREGPLHDKMVAAFAEKLGLPATDLEARLDKGETMYQVAESQGITSEKFVTMMTEVRGQVLDQAVKDGTLTQEQADWMKQRGVGMGRGFRDQGDCPCLDIGEDS